MKESSPILIKQSFLDSNLEEYVRSEMQKSMISTTGIPKSFRLPNNSSAFRSSADDVPWQHRPSIIPNVASSKTLRIGRSNSYMIKQENMMLHKHKKMLEKITVPCQKSYYEKLPIKPGFLFFDTLIKAPRCNIEELKVNIPECVYYSDKMYFLHTLETGAVECTCNIFGYKFMTLVEKFRHVDEKNLYDKIGGIIRGPTEELNALHKIVLDWNQFKVKMIGNEFSSYSMTQRYIHTPGHRPAITRLHYFSHEKNNKANYAYFINNVIFDLPDNLQNLQKCVVNTQDPKNIEYFTKSGSSIKYYEFEAYKIVKYLNKGYNLRIEKIILDFMTDSDGKIWLIGCKGCEIDSTTIPGSLAQLAEWWPGVEAPPVKKQENQYLMTFVHCKLCRLYYTNNQLSHLVSVRMLMLFKVHSLRRVELPLDTSHLKVTSADMLSQSVRICQYCYMLVTTEFELIHVEEALASAMCIPKKDLTYTEDPRLDVQKHFLPKKLYQWRLLVFMSRIYESKLAKSQNLHLQIKFGDIISAFKINQKSILEKEEEVIVLDLLKVHYFFTSEGKSLEKMINSDIFEIRLTIGDKFNEKVVAGSKSHCLLGLPYTLPVDQALYTKKQIFLFNSSDDVLSNLSVYFGLSCDKFTESSKIKVVLNKYHEVYIPELYYMSIDPLPPEWLELLGEPNLQDESFGNRIEDSEFYKPAMTKSEMLRMEDITSPYKAIPKIYSEKHVNEIKPSNDSLSIYKVVSQYLTGRKSKHSKTSSWSASSKMSKRTSATGRATPALKAKMEDIYKEIMD